MLPTSMATPIPARSPAGSPAGAGAAQGSFLMAEASQYSQYSTASTTGGIHSYEVRLVLELCDLGSLRAALDKGVFVLPDETLNYHAVLDMALDIAKAMLHLHRQSILHSDLKVREGGARPTGPPGVGGGTRSCSTV